MPIPVVIGVALIVGALTAFAGGNHLRASPKAPLATRQFAAFAIFETLLLLPISGYFWAFHGDWFLLYWIDSSELPSALALVGLIAIGVLGALSFSFSVTLLRSQYSTGPAWVMGIVGAALIASLWTFRTRLHRVGTYDQFHGDFGLRGFTDGALLQATTWMGVVLVAGIVALTVRVWRGAR